MTSKGKSKRKVGLDSFKIVRVIGKGSFGKVGTAVLMFLFPRAWTAVVAAATAVWGSRRGYFPAVGW